MREGYKKTEVGVIPEDWEVKSLDGICELIDGDRSSNYPSGDDIVEHGILFLSTSNIKNNKLDYNNLRYITEEKFNSLRKGKLEKNDIIITLRGTIGSVALFNDKNFETGFINAQMLIIRSKLINSNYLHNYLTSIIFKKQLEIISSGSAQPQLTKRDLATVKIVVPPLKEQEKIAEIFSSVDSQIDDTEKLIEKTKELKKGLVKNLLTKGIGHSEFKKTEVGEIPASWEVKKLEDVSERVCVGFVGSCNEHYTLDTLNGIPMVRTTNMSKGILDLDDVKYVTEEFHNRNIKSQLKYGDILVARHGENGKACLYSLNSEANCLNIVIVRPNNNLILSKFLLEVMNSDITIKQINLSTVGSVQNVLNTKTISNLKVIIPCMKEQEKIAQILSSVDIEIEVYETRKQKLEELKKGLMQQLLTGKIRV